MEGGCTKFWSLKNNHTFKRILYFQVYVIQQIKQLISFDFIKTTRRLVLKNIKKKNRPKYDKTIFQSNQPKKKKKCIIVKHPDKIRDPIS